MNAMTRIALPNQKVDPAAMIASCRAKMATYRKTASVMADALRFFDKNPDAHYYRTDQRSYSQSTARSELRSARALNHKVARQIADWKRMAKAERALSYSIAAE